MTHASITSLTPVPADWLIVTDDGVALTATVFEPTVVARATVVILGATAVPQSYYARFAIYLAERDLRVVTLDYRGIGRSRPRSLRGFAATMTDWAMHDTRALLAQVRARFAATPVFVVGHSFGGQSFGLLDELAGVDAALLVGAQFGWSGHWPQPARTRLAFTWRVLVPTLTALFGYLPGQAGLGEDLPRDVAREWARWCSHPEYLVGYHADAQARLARFARPLRFYSFTDDEFAPAGAVDHLVSLLPAAQLEHRRLAPGDLGTRAIGHFGFFRPAFLRTLWAEAYLYFEQQLAAASARTQPVASTPAPPVAAAPERPERSAAA